MPRFSIATLTTLLVFLSAPVYAQTGTLVVTVTQLDAKGGGIVKVGMYDADGFPDVGKEVHGIDLQVEGDSASYVFTNIPVGTYAIAVFQDKNGDGKLNKNLFGIPKEPYGFSANKYGKFGPPAFEDVAFDVEEDVSLSLTINLK